MLIKSDTNAAGKKNSQILKTAYPEAEIKDYSGGYRDFSLVFDRVWRRDEVVDEINDVVAAYRNQHPEILSDPDVSSEDPVVIGTETQNTGSYTTYIIIGAAAIIIVLLLWDKLKK